jgi:hypothetical protein
MRVRRLVVALGLALPLLAPSQHAAAASGPAVPVVPAPAGCNHPTGPARAHCYVDLARGPAPVPGSRDSTFATTGCTIAGNPAGSYTPCDLQNAYNLTSLSTTKGTGSVVAIVDPYDDPNRL